MVTIWVETRKSLKKRRRNVVRFGLITRSQPGYIASKQHPIRVALIEWGELVDWQRKMSSPAYQGMLYDIAVETPHRGWVGTGSSMGAPLSTVTHRFENLIRP